MRFLFILLLISNCAFAQSKAPAKKAPPKVAPQNVKVPPAPLTNAPVQGQQPPLKGREYSYATAYSRGNPSCPKGNCVGEYHGDLPAELKGAPINPATGGLSCKVCAPGIYRYDDYHFVFVQKD